MLKCMITDDEPLALDLLEEYIGNVPYLQLKVRCRNSFEAAKALQEQVIDLIFLDIQMPEMTGLQFIQALPNKPMVILVTAFPKYALEGFDLNAVDYLVKPVTLNRFMKACNKAWEYYQFTHHKTRQEMHQREYFFVNADYSLVKIAVADITWIDGLKDYIKIHLQNSSKPVITLMSMKAIEEQLPRPGFIRVHKSYIVSVKHLTAVRKNSVFIGATEIPVGGNYKNAVEMLVKGS